MNNEQEKNCDCNCGGGTCFHKSGVKTIMMVTLGILALFLLSKTIGEFQSYQFIGTNPTSSGSIVVSGKGEVVAVPDIAVVYFTVSDEALVISDAQAKSTKEMNDILASLKKSGIADKDIKTTNYNIYPRYDYLSAASSVYPYPQGKQVLAAYVVSQSVSVKIRKIADAGQILANLGELGATDISGLTFTNDKIDDLQKQAKDKAIAEAKDNAQKLADSLGVKLVRILNYSEGGVYPMYAKMDALATGMGGAGGSAPVPLSTGENSIMSNVTITYEIK